MLLITITHIMLLIINHYYLSYILKLNDFVCLFVCLFGVDWGTDKSYTFETRHVYVKWANLEQTKDLSDIPNNL